MVFVIALRFCRICMIAVCNELNVAAFITLLPLPMIGGAVFVPGPVRVVMAFKKRKSILFFETTYVILLHWDCYILAFLKLG